MGVVYRRGFRLPVRYGLWSCFSTLCIYFQINSIDFAHKFWLQIASLLALHPQNWYLHLQRISGYFGLWFACAKHHGHRIVTNNACRAINDRVTLWWDDAIDLWVLISLLASVKTSMYSFVNNQLIFFKFEIQKYIHSQIHYTISGIVPVTIGEEVSDHFFTNMQMDIKFTFTRYTDIYITRT